MATKIDKPTEDRPHFLMAYATKDYAGLKTFRDNEYKALQVHAINRAHAKDRKKQAKSGMLDLFAEHEAEIQEASIDDIVEADMAQAGPHVLNLLRTGARSFREVAGVIMESYMLRETNVKNLIVQLAHEGMLDDTWGGGIHKPNGNSIIRLKSRAS